MDGGAWMGVCDVQEPFTPAFTTGKALDNSRYTLRHAQQTLAPMHTKSTQSVGVWAEGIKSGSPRAEAAHMRLCSGGEGRVYKVVDRVQKQRTCHSVRVGVGGNTE